MVVGKLDRINDFHVHSSLRHSRVVSDPNTPNWEPRGTTAQLEVPSFYSSCAKESHLIEIIRVSFSFTFSTTRSDGNKSTAQDEEEESGKEERSIDDSVPGAELNKKEKDSVIDVATLKPF